MYRSPFLFSKVSISSIGSLLILAMFFIASPRHLVAQENSRPNIVFILADDLGYSDLGCYGQKLFATPNIDKLANEGLKFTSHYAGAPVCAPSRSALMTGLHTGHTFVRGNKEVEPEGQWPLPQDARTLLEMLKNAGYTTGVFGKWGLGYPGSEGAPENQAVDEFFGYNCQRLAHNYYPGHLWDNTKKIVLDGNSGTSKHDYAPQIIHEQALKFLDKNKDESFFLFYPMVIPHAELAAPEKYMAQYRGKYLPEKKYDGVDAGESDFRNGPYGSQPESHAAFAAMLHLLDEQVGEVVDRIRSLGLDEKTLIIFSSDNGPHVEGGGDPDYFNSNGIFRGYKRDLYEGGIRVPMIARWSSVIAPGTVTDHVSAFWDFMPTFGALAGGAVPSHIDGISFLPTLLGKEKQQQHDHLYWEFHEQGGRRALRAGAWKLVQYDVNKNPQGAYELYNLESDPGEKSDLAAKFPKRVASMKKILLKQHTPSKIFPFAGEKL